MQEAAAPVAEIVNHPWYLTAMTYMGGVLFYRFQKAWGWGTEQDIKARAAGKPPLSMRANYSAYWSEQRYVILYDASLQILCGLAWASGLLTEGFEFFDIKVPDAPTATVWYPFVFMVAAVFSSFLSERLKNRMLKKSSES